MPSAPFTSPGRLDRHPTGYRQGLGVLATADSQGNVNAAVYSRPHFLEQGSLTFIMRDRLTRHNLESNPNAVFLFVENGNGYNGKRLYLRKLKEELDPESCTSGKAGGLKNVNRSKRLICWPPQRWRLPAFKLNPIFEYILSAI